MARKRWLQENNFLKEKRQGYRYSHIFSHHFGEFQCLMKFQGKP